MQKKKITDLLQLLCLEISWLSSDEERIERLNMLLGEVASVSSDSGIQLVSKLLRRYVFLTSEDYEQRIYSMAKNISERFDLATSVICATTGDRNKDSAQKILYDINSVFPLLGCFKTKTLNRYDAAFDNFKKDSSLKVIILVDEFVGTGSTVVGRVNRIKSQFTSASKPVPLINFVGLAGMEFGLGEVEKVVDSLHVEISLKKGISQLSSEMEMIDDYCVMDSLELNLSSDYQGTALPNRGYGSSEALFARKGGSCPNNVFPLFWWPRLKDQEMRRPLFPRSM